MDNKIYEVIVSWPTSIFVQAPSREDAIYIGGLVDEDTVADYWVDFYEVLDAVECNDPALLERCEVFSLDENGDVVSNQASE